MGARGPAPKRVDKRHGHRSQEQNAVTRIDGAASSVPALDIEAPHPLAASWYDALVDGPEARFYTPAMWQRARITAEMLSRLLRSARPSSQMYAALQVDWRALLCDAAEMRRCGIEVSERKTVAQVIDWRARADCTQREDADRG